MILSNLKRVCLWLTRLCFFLSAACLIAIMCLTVVEVIGRYGFNAPIFGRQDIAQILLACSIFLAFPVVTLRGEQIDVDLLDNIFSKRFAFWRDQLVALLISASLITMGYWLFFKAEKALSRGIASELLFLPKFPLIYFIATIVFLTGLLVGIRSLLSILLPKKPTSEHHQ